MLYKINKKILLIKQEVYSTNLPISINHNNDRTDTVYRTGAAHNSIKIELRIKYSPNISTILYIIYFNYPL